MRIILIDNYDSFTYNLVHVIEEFENVEVVVKRNDKLSIEEIEDYDAIILSPGSGIPSEAGLLLPIIEQYAHSKPILGVCLGHQAIAESFGGELINISEVFHGIQSDIRVITPTVLFDSIEEDTVQVGRYHSWIVNSSNLPECLEVTAVSEENQIMAIQHKHKPIFGVQFHPESVLTPLGKKMIGNFIKVVSKNN